jgi:hypothetical protein
LTVVVALVMNCSDLPSPTSTTSIVAPTLATRPTAVDLWLVLRRDDTDCEE